MTLLLSLVTRTYTHRWQGIRLSCLSFFFFFYYLPLRCLLELMIWIFDVTAWEVSLWSRSLEFFFFILVSFISSSSSFFFFAFGLPLPPPSFIRSPFFFFSVFFFFCASHLSLNVLQRCGNGGNLPCNRPPPSPSHSSFLFRSRLDLSGKIWKKASRAFKRL